MTAALVQQVAPTIGTSPLTVNVTTTAGNLIVVAFRDTSGNTITAVSDSKGNTYTLGVNSGGTGAVAQFAWARIVTPLVSTDTISYTSSTGGHLAGAWGFEFSGALSADQNGLNLVTTSTAVTATTPATTQPVELAVTCIAASLSASAAAISGWNLIAADSGVPNLRVAWKALSTTGVQTAAWTSLASSSTIGCVIQTFSTVYNAYIYNGTSWVPAEVVLL